MGNLLKKGLFLFLILILGISININFFPSDGKYFEHLNFIIFCISALVALFTYMKSDERHQCEFWLDQAKNGLNALSSLNSLVTDLQLKKAKGNLYMNNLIRYCLLLTIALAFAGCSSRQAETTPKTVEFSSGRADIVKVNRDGTQRFDHYAHRTVVVNRRLGTAGYHIAVLACRRQSNGRGDYPAAQSGLGRRRSV